MKRHPLSPKVGFSLRIDDIPDHFELKDKVINWESQFWEKEVEPGIYDAPIDTTFALYRPYTKYRPRFLFLEHHLRVSYPYSMHHLPWYVDKNNLSENEKFYVELSKKKDPLD